MKPIIKAPKHLKTVLVCKMDKNDITLKLCKTIELIKYNVCAKYEPFTKWATPGIKEKKNYDIIFAGSF